MATWRVLRASTAWRILPVALAVELFAIFSRGTPWLGEWNWTTDWVNGATILTMPLVAACAAYDASTMLRSESRALVVTTPRGLLGFTWPMWSSFLVLAPVHVVGLLCGFALNIYAGAGDAPSLMPVPLAFTALAAAAAIGLGIGLAVPNVVAAPLAGALLLGVNIVGNALPPVMRIGGATGTLVGQTWDRHVLLLDHVVHVGLAVGLTLGAASLVWPRTTSAPRSLVLGACTLAVVASLLALQWQPAPRLEPSTRPVALACHESTVEVCLAEATSRKLPSLSRAIEEQLGLLRAAAVAVPTRFQQVIPGQPRLPAGVAPLFVEADVLNATSTSAQEAAFYVTQPTQCPQLTADKPPPAAYFETRQLLHLWLLDSQGEVSPATLADEAVRRWLHLPASTKASWVRATYEQLSTCELAELRMPTEG